MNDPNHSAYDRTKIVRDGFVPVDLSAMMTLLDTHLEKISVSSAVIAELPYVSENHS